MVKARSIIVGSERATPPGTDAGEVAPERRVRVYLKTPAPRPAPHAGFRERADVQADRQISLQPSIKRLRAFAELEGLKLVEVNPARRLVRLEGTAAAVQAAFGTQLRRYEHEGAASEPGQAP